MIDLKKILTNPTVIYRGSQTLAAVVGVAGAGAAFMGGDMDMAVEFMQWGGLYLTGTGAGEGYIRYQKKSTP